MLYIFKFYYSFKLQTSYHIYFKFPFMGSPSLASLPCNNPVCRIWQNSTRSCVCRCNHMHHVQYDLLYQNSGGSRGGAAPPVIFRPNWGSKGQKMFFWRPAFPPPQPPCTASCESPRFQILHMVYFVQNVQKYRRYKEFEIYVKISTGATTSQEMLKQTVNKNNIHVPVGVSQVSQLVVIILLIN